uniref:Uncharacterized protein n=1 Tax=Panagrolaimus sp. JU765 TaxID=591449 RepID=A0AC34PX21_9BILA
MKPRDDGKLMNRRIKDRVIMNEGTGRQYRTFMFVKEYMDLFVSSKLPKKYDKWPISALYANMFRLDYYPKLVIFMMFSIKVKYLMAVAPYYSADTQNQMAHPIPALRMALENDKDRFMESLLQLKHAMVKFNDKSDSFSEKMSNMIKVLTPKD